MTYELLSQLFSEGTTIGFIAGGSVFILTVAVAAGIKFLKEVVDHE